MPRFRRCTVASNAVQSMTSIRSFDPRVKRTCSVPRTRPGRSPFSPAIAFASSNPISRSTVVSIPSRGRAAEMGKGGAHIYVLRSSDKMGVFVGHRSLRPMRARKSRGAGRNLNRGEGLPARGEEEFASMEEARPNALEVAEETDAPPKARAEDAATLIRRGHGVARYPSGLQSWA